MAAATSSNTSTATVSEGAIPSILLRSDAAAAREHQAHLIHGHEAHTQLSRRPDGLRGDREYHEVYEGGDPEGWPQARGVPPYRPLRSNDAASRPLGATAPERVFVTAMFTGVLTNHVIHEVWANTVGRVTKKTFVYPTGGQF
ncbi:hypothetical protein BMF94_2768 [Rhodotorula taiwanensis]|uniref:Uncharacterized protein n=1 Tax=Rhodotorula taiwanensis TaxID=741276 RepID=A0A2S5BBP6_9BASI|nr:hypothetical protein BMF94_2768 [Rhodotorula taiwanensis]